MLATRDGIELDEKGKEEDNADFDLAIENDDEDKDEVEGGELEGVVKVNLDECDKEEADEAEVEVAAPLEACV